MTGDDDDESGLGISLVNGACIAHYPAHLLGHDQRWLGLDLPIKALFLSGDRPKCYLITLF